MVIHTAATTGADLKNFVAKSLLIIGFLKRLFFGGETLRFVLD